MHVQRGCSFHLPGTVVMILWMALFVGCGSLPQLLPVGEGGLTPLTISSIATADGPHSTQITIQASGRFSYTLSTHEDRPRLLVEIPAAQFVGLRSHIPVHKGVVRTIDLQEREGQARIEIGLERLVSYEVQEAEKRLVLSFKAPQVSEVQNVPAPERGMRPPLPTSVPSGMVEASNAVEYAIGETDVLEVIVYQEPDLSGTFHVSADGAIAFPLLGNVRVASLSPTQAQEKLEALLREGYLKRPQVSVTVKEYRSKGVAILGAVRKPGTYHLVGGRTTLLELISMAGGFSTEEGNKSVVLLRVGAQGESKSYTFDLERLLKQKDVSMTVTIQPNDTVYVMKADTVIVYGEVRSPGIYALESKQMTVLEVIAKAGGFTPHAAPNRTRVIRVEDGMEKSIRVRMADIIAGERTKDLTVRAGDVIVVPESYF